MAKNYYLNNKKLYECILDYADRCAVAEERGLEKPPMPDYAGECILMLCNRMSTRYNFVGYCVDEETEALTKRGWLRHDEITVDDEILSYDMKTRRLTWSSIFSIYKNAEYDGKMYHLTAKNFDALVTPGHKFVVTPDREKDVNPRLQTIELLNTGEAIVLKGDPVEDPDDEIYDDDVVRLIAYTLKRGWVSKRAGVRVTSYAAYICLHEKEKLEWLRGFLREWYEKNPRDRKGMWRTSSDWRELIYDDESEPTIEFKLSGELAQLVYSAIPNSTAPTMDFLLSLSQRQRILFLAHLLSNGELDLRRQWRDKRNGVGFITCNKEYADSIIALCTMAGLTITMRYSNELYNVRICERSVTTKSVAAINMHGGRTSYGYGGGGKTVVTKKDRPNVPTVQYKGTVWCPETEYGSFVCRRKNCVYVTGNSYRQELCEDAVVDCVAAFYNFDPYRFNNPFGYFSMVSWRAMVRRIYTEKRETYVKHKSLLNAYLTGEHWDAPDDFQDSRAERRGGVNADSSSESGRSVSEGVVEQFEELLERRRKPKEKKQ